MYNKQLHPSQTENDHLWQKRYVLLSRMPVSKRESMLQRLRSFALLAPSSGTRIHAISTLRRLRDASDATVATYATVLANDKSLSVVWRALLAISSLRSLSSHVIEALSTCADRFPGVVGQYASDLACSLIDEISENAEIEEWASQFYSEV